VHVLGVVHGDQARAGVFADAVAVHGHILEEWSLAWGAPPPRPIDGYGAVIVFGGAMHADQDDRHPWLREETLFLHRLLDRHVPVLGLCLGAQLLARAAHADVLPSQEPEIGWHSVELLPHAGADPLLGALPQRFDAFQWHYYTYRVPAGATELARSPLCTQAFRLGDAAWGVQFHPEVTHGQIRRWLAAEGDRLDPRRRDELARQTAERIAAWNELGRGLCTAFLELAEPRRR
jgi:GMP synthase (glutamine-hydrolysing)